MVVLCELTMVTGEVVFNMFCFDLFARGLFTLSIAGARLNNVVIKKAQRGAELVADLLRWVQHLEVDVLYVDGNQGAHRRNGAQFLLAACFTEKLGFNHPILNHRACTIYHFTITALPGGGLETRYVGTHCSQPGGLQSR